MGTSGSSTGSPSGVSLIPPWVSDPDTIDNPENVPDDTSGDSEKLDQESNTPIAPPARFRGARINFGNYGKSGDERSLRRGLGHYVRTGYGGKATTSSRLKGTVQTAGSIFNTLSAIASGDPSLSGTALDTGILESKTARQIIGAIVSTISPADGTQDTEARRAATNDAFSELLVKYPDADLLDLSTEQRLDVMEFFIGNDIFSRVWLDIGRTIQDKAPSAGVALQRLRHMKEYIKSEIGRIFSEQQATRANWDSGTIQGFVRNVISLTLDVFEDYL